MSRALDISATGMTAMQYQVDVLSHNVANVNTTGFKREKASFKTIAYQTEVQSGAKSSEAGARLPSGIQFGLGVAISTNYRNFEQGPLVPTPSTPLNVAINGKGFLMVTLPTGEVAYTRDGVLQKNADGVLVSSDGYEISPGITIPENALNITITGNGMVQASIPNQVEPQELGQIELAVFNNPAGLEAISNNLFVESVSSGAPIIGNPLDEDFGEIKQNFVEDSNVNAIEELTTLIKAQRSYEMNSKIIQSADKMLATVIDAKA